MFKSRLNFFFTPVMLLATVLLVAPVLGQDAKSTSKEAAPVSGEDKTVPPTPTAAPAAKPVEDPAAVIAAVNGAKITKGELQAELNRIEQQALRSGRVPSSAGLPNLQQMALDNLISRQLLSQAAEQKGVKLDQKEIDDQIEGLKKRFPSEEAFKEALAKMNVTLDELKRDFTEGLRIQKFIEQEFVEKTTVTEQEKKDHYNKHRDEFKQAEQVKARHILVKVDPKDDEAKKAEALKKIEALKARVEKGEDFAKLAEETSEGPSKSSGGDLGFFRRGQMVKPFEDAAFALEPGKTSGVVVSDFGYHIIKVEDKKPERVASYEEIQERLGEYLKQEKIREKVTAYLKDLRDKAKVEIIGNASDEKGKKPEEQAPKQ
ncbi:MAG: peptidylprolyl isomerase [Pseudomonadota bacterium]